MTGPALRLDGLTLRYDGQVAVDALSGSFPGGSLTAVVGPNGAGKTTLLRALAGLHAPSAGRIERGGLPPAAIGLLPQSSRLDRSFPLSCLDVVASGHWPRLGAFRAVTPAMLMAARQALDTVGLAALAARPIGALSAGQFQRALFARLIVQDARLLLLDEPFNAVDAATGADLLDLLHRWHRAGRTLVVVLHDLDLVARAFPTTLLLARHAVAWGPTATALSAANRQRARLATATWDEAGDEAGDEGAARSAA